MLSPEKIALIGQAKMNALAAKYLHEKRGAHFRRWSKFVDYVAVAVPAFYLVLRFLFKGHEGAEVVEVVWELLAGLLIVLVLWKLIYGLDAKAEAHANQRAANVRRAREADELIGKARAASDENANWFLRLVENDDNADGAVLADEKPAEKQAAYRAALKEFAPGSVGTVCPSCGASPWRYKAGECQLCGGTPVAPSETSSLPK